MEESILYSPEFQTLASSIQWNYSIESQAWDRWLQGSTLGAFLTVCYKNPERTFKSLKKTLSKENMYQHFNIIWLKVSRLICWVANNLLSQQTRKLNSSPSDTIELESVKRQKRPRSPAWRPGNSNKRVFLLKQGEICKAELMGIKL